MTAPPSTRANAVGIVVDDMGASLAFYRRCGLAVPPDAGPDSPHVDIVLEGGFRLMLDALEVAHALHPGWTAPSGVSRVGFAIEHASPDEVDAAHARLVAAGHPSHLDPVDVPWGQRDASVLDPNGVAVDLYAPLD